MDDFEYDYFMVRVRRLPAGTGATSIPGATAAGETGETGPGEIGETRRIGVSGVAERLDTGEKHLFRNGAELLDVMLGGHAGPKLRRDSSIRNDGPDAAPGR